MLVTDDVASGPAGRREERRGIAGDLMVFKIAGAAAERVDYSYFEKRPGTIVEAADLRVAL